MSINSEIKELMFEYPLYKTYTYNGSTRRECYRNVDFKFFSLNVGDNLNVKSHLDETLIGIYIIQADNKVKVFLDVIYRDGISLTEKED